MIVICDKCSTKYKLDDATITEDGVKVRCSKCGSTFVVKKPRPGDVEKITQPESAANEPQSQLTINNDLDKVINDTISNLTANQPKTADTGTEFDWSALNETADTKAHDDTPPPPPAFEWKPDETLDTVPVQPKNREEPAKTSAGPEQRQQAAKSLQYSEPNISEPTAEHVIKESMQRDRSGQAASTVLSVLKKTALGVLVLIVLSAAGYGIYLFREQLLAKGTMIYTTVATYLTPGKQLNLGVSVSDSRGYFLKNIRGQQLFVIEGNVMNITEHPVSFIKLSARIADNNNTTISSRTFFAGNILTDDELRTYTSDQINALLNNEMGQSLKNFNIPSKASIPFMAVFFDVPDNLSSFTVTPQSTHLGVQ